MWRKRLDGVASVSMIVVAVVLLFNLLKSTAEPPIRPPVRIPEHPVSLDGLAVKGDPKSKVGLVIYSDFQCPFCRRFAVEVLPAIDRTLVTTGLVRTAFKHLPAESVHPAAFGAATLAECGRHAGNFWGVHDRLFAQPILTPDTVAALAQREGIQLDSVCWTRDGQMAVKQHQAEAERLGIVSTPTFLIGSLVDNQLSVKNVLIGYQSVEAITAVVTALRSPED